MPSSAKTPLEATDDLGVMHRMWPVIGPHGDLRRSQRTAGDKPIFIADGHHRYETALNYRTLEAGRHDSTDDDAAANFVLMMFVGMSDPGLAILPTHRLVSGLPPITAGQSRQLLDAHFELEAWAREIGRRRQTWELMDADGGQDVFGFGTAADGQWLFARLTDASPMAALWRRPKRRLAGTGREPAAQAGAGSSSCNGGFTGSDASCRYVHLIDEVTEAMAGKSCQLACLVAPAGIDHVETSPPSTKKCPRRARSFTRSCFGTGV